MHFNLRILQSLAIVAVSLALTSPAVATSTSKHTSTSSKSHKTSKSAKASSKSKKSKSAKSHGQRTIEEGRTTQIQEALIREHYLTGEPTGKWDQSTKDALARFQEANGWQTKSVPDSRALIKLGLGPDKKGLLNPDTAVMSSPHELGTPENRPGGSTQQ